MSVRKSSHGTIFLIVSSGSPLALIDSSLRSTSKNPFCPMTRSLHPPITACGQRVRFARNWREEFFEVPHYLMSRALRRWRGQQQSVVNCLPQAKSCLDVSAKVSDHNLLVHDGTVRSKPGAV